MEKKTASTLNKKLGCQIRSNNGAVERLTETIITLEAGRGAAEGTL